MAINQEDAGREQSMNINSQGGVSTETLLRRAFIFLEDGEWEKADAYCERALDTDPENAIAYLGKYMAELHLNHEKNIFSLKGDLTKNSNFKKALKYSKGETQEKIKAYLENAIKQQEEETRLNKIAKEEKIKSDIENGAKYVSQGMYQEALKSIVPILSEAQRYPEAYWTALLARYTCKNTKELILYGNPLEGDYHYEKILECSTEEEKEYYYAIAKLVKLGTIIRFIICVYDGDQFLAEIWKDKYFATCDNNDSLKKYLDGILNGIENICILPKNILYLRKEIYNHLQVIDNCGEELVQELQDEFEEKITALYQRAMRHIKSLVLGKNVYWNKKLHSNFVTEKLVNSVISGLGQEADASKNSPAQKYIKSKGVKKGRGIDVAADKSLVINCSIEELADCWADPTNDFQNGKSVPAGIDIGLDFAGTDSAMRYITLAREILEYKGLSERDRIAELIERARQGAKGDSVIQEECVKAYEDMCSVSNATLTDLKYLSDKYSDIPELAWKYVEKATEQFTRATAQDYTKDKTYDNLMAIGVERLLVRDAHKKIQSLKDDLAKLNKEEQNRKGASKKYAERAIAGKGHRTSDYKKQWDAYLSFVAAEFEKNRSIITNRIQELEKKSGVAFKKGKTSHTITGIINSCVSIGFIIGMMLLCLKAKKYIDTPSLILQYNNFWFHIVTILGSIGIGTIVFFALSMICGSVQGIADKKDPYKGNEKAIYKEPLVCNIVNTVSPIVIVLLTIGMAGMFFYSLLMFPQKIGTINISNMQELQYIKNYPDGDFVLANDIDCEGKEIVGFARFTGNLDGQQHAINNFVSSSNCFIKKNKGSISNLIIGNATLSDALIQNNSGILKNVILKNVNVNIEKETGPKNSAMFVNVNKEEGIIQNCAITESTFYFNYSQKLAKSECNIGGMVAQNLGSVVASSISANIQGKVKLTQTTRGLYIGSFAGDATYDYKIVGCSSTANLTVEITDKLQDGSSSWMRIGGFLGNGTLSRSCFKGNMNINYLIESEGLYRSYSKLKQWYYIGGLIGDGSAENCYATGSINTHFVEDPDERATLIACVGSLLGDSGKLNNCYANMSYNMDLFDGIYNGAEMMGDSANILNSFLYPAQNATNIFSSRNGYNGNQVENSYYAAGCGYSNSWWFNGGVETSARNFKSASFITGTLGWDTNIWNIVDGQLPTLKPYVISNEAEITGQ